MRLKFLTFPYIQFLFIIALLLSSENIYSNTQLEKLRNEFHSSKDDSTRARKLISIAWVFNDSGNDSAIYYVEKALDIAIEHNIEYEIAHAHYALGNFYYFKANYKMAILNLEKSFSEFEDLNKIKEQVRSLKELGNAYSGISEFSRSLEYYLHTAELNKLVNDSTMMAVVYNNIGVLFTDLKLHENSISYYNEALAIDRALLDTVNIIIDYNNLSNVYAELKQKDSTFSNLQKAIRLSKSFELNDFLKIMLDQSLGEYHLEFENLDSAKYFLNKSLIDNLKYNRPLEISYSYYFYGKYFKKIRNFKEAINYYEKALSVSKSFEFSDQNAQIFKDLSEIYHTQNNFHKAYETLLSSRQISDSLDLNKARKDLTNYELRKELESSRIRITLEQESAKQKLEFNASRYKLLLLGMVITIIMVLLVMGTFIRAYFIKKKSHKILEDQNTVIELQKEDLRKLNATKDKFFSLIAHDLKNPFNIMIGYTDLLLHDDEYKDYDKVYEILSILNKTAIVSHLFLENLLDWARSQSGHLKVEASKFNLNDLIQYNIDFFTENAALKGIKLQAELREDLELSADRKMIDTVLRNIISNAIKFTNIGGKVKITNFSENDSACISITDNGIGISHDNIDKLFVLDDHFQVDGTADEKGTGLGLILCKEFIDKNGGSISVESQVGKGSTFTICLPLDKTSTLF